MKESQSCPGIHLSSCVGPCLRALGFGSRFGFQVQRLFRIMQMIFCILGASCACTVCCQLLCGTGGLAQRAVLRERGLAQVVFVWCEAAPLTATASTLMPYSGQTVVTVLGGKPHPDQPVGRRLEVVVDGLPLWSVASETRRRCSGRHIHDQWDGLGRPQNSEGQKIPRTIRGARQGPSGRSGHGNWRPVVC